MLPGTSMPGARHDGDRQRLPRHQMTPAWKRAVLLALKARGKNKAWLASQLGVGRGHITQLFKVDDEGNMVRVSSEYVPRICELLDLPTPLVDNPPIPEPRDARIVELLRTASPALKDAVIEILSARSKTNT